MYMNELLYLKIPNLTGALTYICNEQTNKQYKTN